MVPLVFKVRHGFGGALVFCRQFSAREEWPRFYTGGEKEKLRSPFASFVPFVFRFLSAPGPLGSRSKHQGSEGRKGGRGRQVAVSRFAGDYSSIRVE